MSLILHPLHLVIQQLSNISNLVTPLWKESWFNLLDDEDFIIPYSIDTIPNLPAGRQLPSQANKNLWIIAINEEDPIKDQGILDEINRHKNHV